MLPSLWMRRCYPGLGLAIALTLLPLHASFAQGVSFSTSTIGTSRPTSVVVGDFNRDGNPDLAETSGTTFRGFVVIHLGDGTGSFGAPTTFPVGREPLAVAVGDFNRDKKLDLAVANFFDHTVTILLGNGDGTFEVGQAIRVSGAASSVAVGDFSRGHKQDLAVVSPAGVDILLGDGKGSFGAPTNFPAGRGSFSLAVGDFNADRKLDLAVTNLTSSPPDISVLLGNGDGTFGPPTNFAVGAAPLSVAVGDFDGDGKLDLAVANNGSNSVSILLGDGKGSFGPATNFAVGNHPNSVAVGDLNGDGKLDLAVANSRSDTVSILLGDGKGSFGPATNFPVGVGPSSVAVTDLNGDGKLDLAVGNFDSSTVSILLNTTVSKVTISGKTRCLTTDPASQFDPSISGNIVVYTDLRNGNADVFYFDLLTNTETQLTTGTADEQLNDVSGNTIVWTDFAAMTGGGDIKGFTIGRGFFDVAVDPATAQRNPGIGGSLVAWEDNRDGNWEIYAKDLSTGVTKRLTNTPSATEMDPAASGRRAAYARGDATGSQIFVTDFDTLTTTQLTNAGTNMLPDISGDRVVYQGNRDGNQDIYFFDLAANRETRISLPSVQRNPNTSGDWISFEDTSTGTSAIKLYHIPSGSLFTAVSSATSNAFLNDIDGQRVAFTSDISGNLDICVFEFTVTAPVATVPDLIALVQSFNLSPGIENSFIVKLQSILASINAGITTDACNDLNAFINEVQAQTGKALTPGQAQQLIAAANQVKASLRCP